MPIDTHAAGAASYQTRVDAWLMACFGEAISRDKVERNHRFLEEALELVQACDCTASEAHQLVDYVFGRPVGEPQQESGGVSNTHAALCLAQGIDMEAAAEAELARVWTKVEKIRAKQAAKPKNSPLPATASPAPGALADLRALSEAATPGEWVRDELNSESICTLHGVNLEEHGSALSPDARFIVALVNAYRSGTLIASSPAASAPLVDGGERVTLSDLRLLKNQIGATRGLTKSDPDIGGRAADCPNILARQAFTDAARAYVISLLESAPTSQASEDPPAVWIRRAIMANLKGESDGVDDAVAVIVSNLSHPRPASGAAGLVEALREELRLVKLRAEVDEQVNCGALRDLSKDLAAAEAALARHATPDGEATKQDPDSRHVKNEAMGLPANWLAEDMLRVETDTLVTRFADALKARLRLSADKPNRGSCWQRDGWRETCQRELVRHIAKGDPLDVAAYAAFCWYHGWPTATPQGAGETAGGDTDAARSAAGVDAAMASCEADGHKCACRQFGWQNFADNPGVCNARLSAAFAALATAAPEQAGSRGWEDVRDPDLRDAPWMRLKDNPSVAGPVIEETARYITIEHLTTKTLTRIPEAFEPAPRPAAARPHSDAEGRS